MDADPPFVKEINARAARGDAACQGASRCLQATRSVICSSKCAPTGAAYFAAVVSALQQLAQKGALENQEESLSSLLLILRRALPQLPSNLVAGRLNDIVTALTPLFRTGSTSSETSTRQALQCLSCCAEAAYSVNARPNRKVLRPIFGYLSDPRSAVRRQAELSAVAILQKAKEDPQTLAFASQQLTQMLQNASNTDKKAEEIPAQRAVSLLRATAPLIPDEQLGDIFVALTRLPALLGQHPCCTAAFDFAAEHFTPEEAWEEDEMVEAAPNRAELAARFLPGLLEVPLSMLNVAYVAAFVRATAAAVAQLCGKEASPLKLAATKKILSLFSEQDPGLLRAAGKACSTIFSAAGEREDDALLQDLLETLRPLLRFEVKGSWCFALPAVGALFDALDSRRSQLDLAALQQWDAATFQCAKPLVMELIEVRDKSRPGELNVYGKELQEAISSAIKTFGPQQVLRSMPLEVLQHPLTDVQFEQKSRSWMLLALKDSCQRTALQDFSNFFIPLASALKAKASEAAQQDAPVLEKKYLTLVEQVWALLPGFCTEPLDMQSALLANGGQLAKQLVAVLQNDGTLRDYIWAGLKRLCDASLQPSSRLTEALQKDNQACLKTLQSRLMPEMLNVYIKMHAEMEGQDASRKSYSRQQALQAIASYAQLVDATYIGTIFKSLVAKWLKATTGEGDGDASDVPALGDLATILIPHLGVENLELVLRVFAPALSGSEDKAMASAQKAGYQAITAVMQHEAAASLWKVQEVASLWATLQEARQTCTALKARLLCLQALLSLLASSLGPRCTEANVKQEYLQCLTTIIPEVLFHLRDQSTAVREAARESLHLAATTAIHQDLQAEIVTLISAGLAGLSRHAKAAALDALSRLMYEHHSKMAVDLRKRLIHVVLLLLDDHDPQVWRGALKFTKVVVFVVPKEGLLDLLPKIMKLFESRHLASAKMLVRSIVERLVKILPEEILEEAFPKAHQALLRHVQKQFTRLGRPQTVREKNTDDRDKEEEQEEETGGVEGRKAKREKKAEENKETWESFKAGDEAEADLADGDKTEETKVKKRSRGGAKNEPPTESVMAHNAVQALLDAWEAESDEEGGRGKQGKRKRDIAASTWIQEDGNVPIDFMSADAAHSVLTVRAPPSKKIRGARVGNAGAENQVDALRRNGLRFAADGRLVVDETAEVMEDQRKEFSHGTASEKPKALSQLAMQRKTRAEARAKAKAARKGVHLIKGLDTYKPGRKKAQGDAKRKGSKLEPFAYVRLNPKVTKEKFKTKATETFAKVVQGAKKGVVKGMKARAREQKLKHAREVKKRKKAHSTVKTRRSR